MALSDSEIEAVAARVVELLRPPRASGGLVDAAEIARRFGVSRAFVYDHAEDLGALRLGSGSRARLRFDPGEVDRKLRGEDRAKLTGSTRNPVPRRKRIDLLPIRPKGR